MKKYISILLLFCCMFSLNAYVLPEGSDVRIKNIGKDSNGNVVSASFSIPAEINTPFGKILSTGTVFF